MSVYITGDLKIPEANFRLVQLWNDGTACWKQDGKFMRGQWKGVSEHGDLIDIDSMLDDFSELRDYDFASREYVVIPAERSGG